MNASLKPKSALWRFDGFIPGSATARWVHLDGSVACSSVDDCGEGPEYHVSLSRGNRRLSVHDAKDILLGFETPFKFEQWDEDNHLPGIARHYWCPVDPDRRRPCDCKAFEEPIEEGDYIWRKDPHAAENVFL